MVFADPDSFLNRADEKERYELHENDPADEGYRQFLAQVLPPLLCRLDLGMSGVDYGCGPGPALKQMLEEAGMQMALYDPFYAPDTQVLNQQYDFVTATEVVEHFYHPARDWAQLNRLVKPGGILAVMTSLLLPETDFNAWYYRTETTHVMFYTPETIRYIAKKLNLVIEILEDPVILFRKPAKTPSSEEPACENQKP
jgi:hypothetical protein